MPRPVRLIAAIASCPSLPDDVARTFVAGRLLGFITPRRCLSGGAKLITIQTPQGRFSRLDQSGVGNNPSIKSAAAAWWARRHS